MIHGISLMMVMHAAFSPGVFHLQDEAGKVAVSENGKPALVYNYTLVEPPVGVDAHYRRGGYIHPLYDLDGGVLTEDFPSDHYHHRGVFWAWPDCASGDRPVSIWLLDGIRSHHEAWLKKEVNDNNVVISAVNIWSFDETPDIPVMREWVEITIHAAKQSGRAIDLALRFKNAGDKPFTLRGAIPENKGYGGLSIRTPGACQPMVFTTAMGVEAEDALECKTPWTDVSFPGVDSGAEVSHGLAVFQHPANPGYPHEGWLFRHYGFLGQSWPHRVPHEMAPGDEVTLRYRLYAHRGDAITGGVREAFGEYTVERTSPEH